MAHELDRNTQTGQRSMFSVLATPWHREGVILANAPTYDDACMLAGCNFDVELRPLHVANPDGTFVQSPSGKMLVRSDRGNVLDTDCFATVGDQYEPLQHRDAFAVLQPLLDKGVATLETGGTLREGRDAWMLVRFVVDDPVVQEVFAGEIIPFGLVANNHGGGRKVRVKKTPVRVCCANTLGMTENDGWSEIGLPHRRGVRVKLVEAAEQMFGEIVERYRRVAEQYAVMKKTYITVDEFTSLVLDTAAPLPPKAFTPEGQHLTTRGYDAAYEAASTRRAAIQHAWLAGKGHTGVPSAWYAYNGAVEVIDHDTKLYRTRGSRVASMLAGRLSSTKTAVLDNLLTICKK